MHIVLTFNSTHHALAAERAVKAAAIPNEVLPTPRDISSNCGLSLRIEEQHLYRVQAILTALNIDPDLYRAPQQRGGAYIPLLKEGQA